MIGLTTGIVKLEDHSVEWDKNAAETIEMLKKVFGDKAVDIQHIGSTSVKGLKAKPIVDIGVGVRSFDDVYPLMPVLEKHGVMYRIDHGDQLFFSCGDFERNIRTHHIHVVIYNGERWNEFIKFRETLTNNPEIRKQYEDLKVRLLREYADNREKYTAMKAEFIQKNCKL